MPVVGPAAMVRDGEHFDYALYLSVENEVGKAAKDDAPDVRFCDELESLR
jgi:hypothetical protein